MAEAPGHRLGQIIGDALELSLEPVLRDFADEHALYLDSKGLRPTRPGPKCTWTDGLGNSHDLDFVLERGGTPTKVGNPAAFIGTAWRRYTKHSRAKAQEIQGALLPLLAKHSEVKPFAGAVVAGRWTAGALQQMTSSGFTILHIGYDEVVRAFAEVGVDVDSMENTPDAYLQQQVDRWEVLQLEERALVGDALRRCAPAGFTSFRETLERVILRAVELVIIVPLHGAPQECLSIEDAIRTVQSYKPPTVTLPVIKFEVLIRHTNGDRIEAQFGTAKDAVAFLRTFIR